MNFTLTSCSCGYGRVLKQRNLMGILDDAIYCQSAPLQRNLLHISTPRHSWHTNGKFQNLGSEQQRWNIRTGIGSHDPECGTTQMEHQGIVCHGDLFKNYMLTNKIMNE